MGFKGQCSEDQSFKRAEVAEGVEVESRNKMWKENRSKNKKSFKHSLAEDRKRITKRH